MFSAATLVWQYHALERVAFGVRCVRRRTRRAARSRPAAVNESGSHSGEHGSWRRRPFLWASMTALAFRGTQLVAHHRRVEDRIRHLGRKQLPARVVVRRRLLVLLGVLRLADPVLVPSASRGR